ncbi:MAG: PDZ domain-containing protein [Bdellovibrionales bacterium]|nr:PDZ domain-containing protein [Bdellovibrionales bacterium]
MKKRTHLSFLFTLLLLVNLFPSYAESPRTLRLLEKTVPQTNYERLNQVLYYVHNQYVDPSRIDFSKMFTASVKYLSLQLAELSYKKDKASIELSIINQSKAFSTKITSIYALRNQLTDLIRFVDQNKKSNPSSDLSLEEVAIAGVLSTLDPHSVYLSKEVLNETNVDIEGKFGGLGIVIGFRDGQLTVISPIDDTPAARAGIEAGDRITKIEKEPTIGMSLTEAVSRMRGPRGTQVTISIMRDGMKKETPYLLTRDIIKVVNTESALLQNDVGYIKLKHFDKNSAHEIAYQIQDLQGKAGKDLQGLILDLRNNPGGLLDQAIGVADIFLEKGSIVSTVERNNRFNTKTKAKKSEQDFTFPLTVLINQGSASASEIVAGALQKNNRALLIGQRTFGKGTVQKIFFLPEETAVKLTISKYLTVNDISIQSIGINPDVETQPIWIKDKEVRFYQFVKFRSESDFENSFLNDQASETAMMTLPYVIETKEINDQTIANEYQFGRLDNDKKQQKLFETFEIKLAHQILSEPSVKKLNRTDLFHNAKSLLTKIEKEKQDEVQIALGKEGIDWTYPPKPTVFCDPDKLEIKTTLTNPKQTFRVGEKIALSTRIKNNADCAFFQVKGISSSKNPVLDQHFVYIGQILPKQDISIQSEIDIPQFQPEGLELLTMNVTDADDRELENDPIYIPFEQPARPLFKVGYEFKQGTTGNTLVFNIENIGTKKSNEVILNLKQKGDKTLLLESARQVVTDLAPGATKSVSIPVQFAPGVNVKSTPLIQAQFADIDHRVVLESDITLKNNATGTIQAPVIELANHNTQTIVGKTSLTIKGAIADNASIKDMYVFVNDEKIYYHLYAQSKDQQNFEITIPLNEQQNTVQIVARDQDDVQGGLEFHLLRNI